AALCGAYAYAVGPLRRKHNLGSPATAKQISYFVAGTALLILALISPLDDIGDQYLFSAHMVQHLLLATLWPPLMLLAMPAWMARRIFRLPALGTLLQFFTYPAVALILF